MIGRWLRRKRSSEEREAGGKKTKSQTEKLGATPVSKKSNRPMELSIVEPLKRPFSCVADGMMSK